MDALADQWENWSDELKQAHAHDGDMATLRDDGRICPFMEFTDFHTMLPRDDLASGSTRWVLANPGDSYIAYTYDYIGPLGIHNVAEGSYDLHWFALGGPWVNQAGVRASGATRWEKPTSMSNEIALYLKRIR